MPTPRSSTATTTTLTPSSGLRGTRTRCSPPGARTAPDQTGELRHGLNISQAAAAAAVPYLVYCSGDGAAPDSPLPLFRVKHQVERHTRSLPIPHTILAPVYFMENLFNPWNLPMLQAGTFPSPIPVEVPMQQVAIADLAKLAVLAIGVLGREFAAAQLPSDELTPGLRALFAWLEHNRHGVDLADLRDRYPEVGWQDYEAWVRAQRARFRQLCPREHAGAL
jgi:uncharacterized protein YbjT (DUF2867 family)